jgi:uncharacterized membrane protein YhaH (DUF805 family)
MSEHDGMGSDAVPNPLAFLFDFKGRIGRPQYFLGLGTMVVLLLCTGFAAANFMDSRGGFGLFIPITIILLIVMAWIYFAIVVQRIRDAGKSGWYFLVFGLGPVVWLPLSIEFLPSLWLLNAVVFLGLILAPAFLPSARLAAKS